MPDNNPPRRDSDETTTRLLDAAAEVFVEHGYDKAVVADIARRAGVTTGAVFGRWANKSEIMAAAVDHIFEQMLPDERVKQLGVDELPIVELLSAWAANILAGDKTQDVMVQVFASARNNDAVNQRLRLFLDEQARQLASILERDRSDEGTVEPCYSDEATVEPCYSTASIVLLIQAIGVGTHLLLSAGRDEQHTPSAQEWDTLIRSIHDSLTTPPPQ